jgi:DNA-binding MarR family transcriptional regulator
MEKAGLIERKRNDSGPKRTLILPTQKGRQLFKEAYPTLMGVITRITRQFPDDELPQFILYLKKVRDAALGELQPSVLKRSLTRHRR